MDFEVRRKIILGRLEKVGGLDDFCEELLGECRRDIICLLEEQQDIEGDAYGLVDQALLTEIYYYNQRLLRDVDEMREFTRCVDELTATQALFILNRK